MKRILITLGALAVSLTPTAAHANAAPHATAKAAITWLGPSSSALVAGLRGGATSAPDHDVKAMWDKIERTCHVDIVSSTALGSTYVNYTSAGLSTIKWRFSYAGGHWKDKIANGAYATYPNGGYSDWFSGLYSCARDG